MNPPVLCEGLSKRFRTLRAVDDLNLQIPEGSIYALIGSNGAGKTTLLKMLVNIFKPTTGRAVVLGVDSRRLRTREFSMIGYVSENQDLPEWMTVEYLLGYLQPFYPAWDRRLQDTLVRELELPMARKVGHLSRGM